VFRGHLLGEVDVAKTKCRPKRWSTVLDRIGRCEFTAAGVLADH